MTEIEQKALALLNEVAKEMELSRYASLDHNLPGHRALCRAIEQHEQFKRQVSDAVEAFFEASGFDATKGLIRFILPKPVHPLVQAAADIDLFWNNDMGAKLEEALAKRGGKIVWENEP